jgi:hypothetical protein
MTDDLADIVGLMRAFDENRLSAQDFVEQYSDLWNALAREQDDAIARNPDVARALSELRDKHNFAEITDAAYSERVQQQYALLEGLRLRPGTDRSRTLSHVFVEADAYREDAEAGGIHATADELHEEVRKGLEALEAS